MLILPLIKEENSAATKATVHIRDFLFLNDRNLSSSKELKHEASSKRLKLNGSFIEQKELMMDPYMPTTPNVVTSSLNEAASYAALKALQTRLNLHLPPKRPPSLLTKLAEFTSQKKS